MVNFVNTNGYVEFWNPVSVQFQNTIPVTRLFMMKSLFSDNANILYKTHSLSTGSGFSGVKNANVKSRRT